MAVFQFQLLVLGTLLVWFVNGENYKTLVESVPSRSFQCKQEGYFPDDDDCNRFYRCVKEEKPGTGFVAIQFFCGPGNVFDEETGECNHPWALSPSNKCYKE